MGCTGYWWTVMGCSGYRWTVCNGRHTKVATGDGLGGAVLMM